MARRSETGRHPGVLGRRGHLPRDRPGQPRRRPTGLRRPDLRARHGDPPPNPPPLFSAIAADDRFFNNQDLGLITSWRASGGRVEFHLYSGGGRDSHPTPPAPPATPGSTSSPFGCRHGNHRPLSPGSRRVGRRAPHLSPSFVPEHLPCQHHLAGSSISATLMAGVETVAWALARQASTIMSRSSRLEPAGQARQDEGAAFGPVTLSANPPLGLDLHRARRTCSREARPKSEPRVRASIPAGAVAMGFSPGEGPGRADKIGPQEQRPRTRQCSPLVIW